MKTEIKTYNILVIEDNPGDYLLLQQFLQAGNISIEKMQMAETMAEAIDKAKVQSFDIALLDLTLPDSEGLDSVKTLSRILPYTPIIVLSGLSTLEIATESISLGVQDYLVKGEYDEKTLAKSIAYSIERKKIKLHLEDSLERYELVNKATQDTIWEWDMRSGSIIRNAIFETQYGYPNEQKINNLEWLISNVHPGDKERVKEKVENCFEKKLTNWQDEYRFKDASGRYRYVYDRGFVLFDEKGTPRRMIGAMSDLTEKKNLEQELADQQLMQQKQLLEVNILAHEEEKNELGRELHDNINQMLATIKMYLGMAKSGHGKPEDDLVGKSYDYLNDAMNELRKLSHSLVSPSLGDIGLKAALQELVSETNLAKTFNIKLDFDKHFKVRDIDKNKELMIYRIVQEQVNNILKHAKAKNVVIAITKEENNLLLSITDDGIGFDTSKKTKGIGLNNISNRVQSYSGTMEIISAPGRGCMLKLEVPL